MRTSREGRFILFYLYYITCNKSATKRADFYPKTIFFYRIEFFGQNRALQLSQTAAGVIRMDISGAAMPGRETCKKMRFCLDRTRKFS